MELKRIHSADLPNIDASVKERVNDGRWTLFRTHQAHPDHDVEYYIKGSSSLYRLDKSGNVISIGVAAEAPSIDELIHFTDIPSPRSVSENRRTRSALPVT